MADTQDSYRHEAGAGQIEARLAAAQRQAWPDEALRRRLDALAPSLPPSPRLRRTGLARAFRGKLVPQDPADEPASVMLDQIEMQRKNPHESRPRRRL